jgi:hypothetical protein
VGALLSMVSLIASAKLEPYVDSRANAFKVATEASLLCTLVLAMLLKINEKDLQKEGLTLGFVGGCMLFETVMLPLAGLGYARLLANTAYVTAIYLSSVCGICVPAKYDGTMCFQFGIYLWKHGHAQRVEEHRFRCHDGQ